MYRKYECAYVRRVVVDAGRIDILDFLVKEALRKPVIEIVRHVCIIFLRSVVCAVRLDVCDKDNRYGKVR